MATQSVRPEVVATIGPVPLTIPDERAYSWGFESYQMVTHPDQDVFSDDFSSPLNLDEWSTSIYDDFEPGVHANLSVTNGQLRMEATGTEVFIDAWVEDYDLWNGYASVKLTHDGGTSRYNDVTLGALFPGHRLLFGVAEDWAGRGAGTFDLYVTFQATSPFAMLHTVNVPYDPAAHRYLRVRETGGTLQWQTSPDGTFWTTITSYTHGLTASAFLASEVRLSMWGGQSPTSNGAPFYPVVVEWDDFRIGLNGWTEVVNSGKDGGIGGAVTSMRAHTGTYSIRDRFERTLENVEVGRTYVVSAWVYAEVSQNFRLGFFDPNDQFPVLAIVPVTAGSWQEVSATFPAPATGSAAAYFANSGAANTVFVDDVAVVREAYDTIGTIDVDASEATITIDDGWTPYAQARVTLPLTDPDLVERVDPRAEQRITITASDAVSGDTRVFDLGLRERSIDHKNGTIEVTLATDEALLLDRCNVSTSVDSTARQHEGSVRGIVQWALDKIGATLEPGTADADLTPHWDARNMIPDPGTAATSGGGYSASGCTLDANDTSWSISGDGDCFNLYNPTTSDSYLNVGPAGTVVHGMRGGTTYVLSASGNVKQAMGGTMHARARRLVVFYRVGPTAPYTEVMSPLVPNVVGAATRVAVEFTLPEGVTEAFIRAYHGHTVGQIRWDGFRLSEKGPGTLTDNAVYFDGDTPDTADYTYAWEGAQDISPSTRTATEERLPTLFDWRPGQSLWDFLQPLLEWSGLRLFCTETKRWFLVNPAEYAVPGYVVVQAQYNATEGTDTISRNDDSWADAVVCVYQWRDDSGLSHEQYDVAGDPSGKCMTRVYEDTPFPGPGAASYILSRLQGKGRTQEVTALMILTATPGQSLTVTLPGTLSQTGTVSRVTFDLAQGLMDLGSRGLTDTYPGSWWAWNPPEQVWNDVDPDLTWDEA